MIRWLICHVYGHAWKFDVVINQISGNARFAWFCVRCLKVRTP